MPACLDEFALMETRSFLLPPVPGGDRFAWDDAFTYIAKAQASGLYFFFYYMGSSVAGAVGGIFWDKAGWPGVAGFVAILVAIALMIAVRESRRGVVRTDLGRQAA